MITRWTVASALLLLQATPAMAGACDLVFRWDNDQIDACLKELRSEIFMLKLQLQTADAENRVMRNNLCLIAGELKTSNAGEIAELACAELREAAKKKATKIKPVGR